MRIVCFQSDQIRLRSDQKSLSGNIGRRRGRFLTMSESCCRNARFSSRRSRRVRKTRAQEATTTPNIRTIVSRLRENESSEHHADFKEDRSFCEAQLSARLKRLRFLVFPTPGKLVHHARRTLLRLPRAWQRFGNWRCAISLLPLPAPVVAT